MQQGGGSGGMRVRNSPFGPGAGQAPAAQMPTGPQAVPGPSSDDFDWDSFGTEFDKPAPPVQTQPVQQPSTTSAPRYSQPPQPQMPKPRHLQQGGIQPQMGVQPPGPASQSGMQPQMSVQFPRMTSPGGMQPQMGVQPPSTVSMQPQMGMQPPTMTQQQQRPSMGDSMMGAGMSMGSAVGLNDAVTGVVAAHVISKVQDVGVLGWFPSIMLGIRQSCNVGQAWVMRKLLILMCPFVQRNDSQGVPPASMNYGGIYSPGPGTNDSQNNLDEDGLKISIEESDLYIPIMSYFTYIVVYSIQRLALTDFRPEILPATFSFGLVLLLFEVGSAMLGFYIAGNVLPFLELLGICGYKYVHIVFMVIAKILLGSSIIYYVFFAYFATCAGFATRRFLLTMEPSQIQQQYGVAPSKLQMHIKLGLAIAQVPLCWLLTPSSYANAAGGASL